MLSLPSGPGVRVDTGVSQGDLIPADFDSMIAKVIAYGRNRDEALSRLRRALADTTVIIEGGATNKGFLLDLLDQPEVIDGSADTGWIDRVRATGRLVSHAHDGIALVAAAIEAYEEQETAERLHFLATAHGGRPQARHEAGRPSTSSSAAPATGSPLPRSWSEPVPRVASPDGSTRSTSWWRGSAATSTRRLRAATDLPGGRRRHGPVHLVEVNGISHRVTRDEGGVMRSPAPALVVAVPVRSARWSRPGRRCWCSRA